MIKFQLQGLEFKKSLFFQARGLFKGMLYPMLSAGALNSLFFGVYGVSLRFMTSLRDPTTASKQVWKFQDFSVTQILREINFGESRSSKFAFFAISRAVKMQKFMKK